MLTSSQLLLETFGIFIFSSSSDYFLSSSTTTPPPQAVRHNLPPKTCPLLPIKTYPLISQFSLQSPSFQVRTVMIRSCIDLLIGLDLSGVNPTKVTSRFHFHFHLTKVPIFTYFRFVIFFFIHFRNLTLQLLLALLLSILPSLLTFSLSHLPSPTFTLSSPGPNHFQGLPNGRSGHHQVRLQLLRQPKAGARL